jgi:putative endonuclease
MNTVKSPKMKAAHLRSGELAEQRACDFLVSHQLTLVERNFRCVHGEIDLIMREGETLVIVEVRFRKNATYGSALESVTASKQAKLIATTEFYLNTFTGDMPAIRFDVIGIVGEGELQWVQNAF